MVVAPVKDALKDVQLSDQEMQKFEKAFKDPEFVKMFGEYAKEMQDPANRAETDAYLRQLEQQGDIERTYGQGTQLIVPEPQFCFKTRSKTCGTKVFVNVCSSDKVEKPSVRPSKDVQGRVGQQWDLPLAGSSCKRVTTDKKGNTAWVWDVTMHTEAFTMLSKQPRLLNLIVESSIEHIENTNQVQLDRKFSRPKLRFKGTPENPEKPAVTAIRGDAAVAQNGTLKPKQVPSDLKGTTSSDAENRCPDTNGASKAADDTKCASASARSPFRFKQPKAQAPQSPTDPGYMHSGGEVHAQTTAPKALVVRVELPKVQSAAEADLEVGAMRVVVKVPTMYLLDILLPFCVEDARGSAKFDTATNTLKLWLPVHGTQPAHSTGCNTLPASNVAEIAGYPTNEQGTEQVDTVGEGMNSYEQQSCVGAAVQSSRTCDQEQLATASDIISAQSLDDANAVAEGSIFKEHDVASSCDQPCTQGGGAVAVEAMADAVTGTAAAAETEPLVRDVPCEGATAGTSGMADCEGSAAHNKEEEKCGEQGIGKIIDLKALALQWESVHRACDAEMAAPEIDPADGISGEASSSSADTKKEGAHTGTASGKAVKKGAKCTPMSVPDVQLGLALELPMLGELD